MDPDAQPEEEKKAAIRPKKVFDEDTGIRRRRRESLGFKKAGAEETEDARERGARKRAEKFEDWGKSGLLTPGSAKDVIVKTPGTDPRRRQHALIALAILAAAGGLAAYSFFRGGSGEGETSPLEAIREPLVKLSPAKDEEAAAAAEVARKFLLATTPGDYGDLVRDSSRVIPLVRKQLARETRELSPVEPLAIEAAGKALSGGAVFMKLRVKISPVEWREMYLEKTDAGHRVDWESFAGYSDFGWREFKEIDPRPVDTILVRARVSPADNYSPPFDDRERFRCLSLVGPGGDFSFAGFADREKDGRLLDELDAILEYGDKASHEATLLIRYPESTVHRFTVEIVDYLRNSWVWDG